jgi:hypothetical protein
LPARRGPGGSAASADAVACARSIGCRGVTTSLTMPALRLVGVERGGQQHHAHGGVALGLAKVVFQRGKPHITHHIAHARRAKAQPQNVLSSTASNCTVMSCFPVVSSVN